MAQELRLYYKPSDRASIILNVVKEGFPPALLFAGDAEQDIIGYSEYKKLYSDKLQPYLGLPGYYDVDYDNGGSKKETSFPEWDGEDILGSFSTSDLGDIPY